jgi:hypothetical protein
VHETKFGLLLKAGPSQGWASDGVEYSTDKEIKDLLVGSTSVKEFKAKLKLRLEQDIEAELVHMSANPVVTIQNLAIITWETPLPDLFIVNRFRNVSLFETGASNPLGEVLVVKPQSDPVVDLRSGTTKYRFSAITYAEWLPIHEFPVPGSVRMLANRVSYDRPDSWVQSHPREALLEMLKRGHEEHKEDIGPPYVLVHVLVSKNQKPRVRWVAKGVCPSWTEDIIPDVSTQTPRTP